MKRRKDGLYQQELPRDLSGGKRKVIYGKTKAELLRKLADYQEAAETGRTFASVAEEWWAQHEPTLAVNSVKNYKPAYKRALEHFGEEPLRQITPRDVAAFLRSFVREHHAAEKTVKTQLTIVNHIFRYAVAEGHLDANPARDVEPPKAAPRQKRSTPQSDIIARIKSSVSADFGLFAYMALYTGCRRGELLALTWEDIDRKQKTICINKSLYYENGRPKIKAPKTAKGSRTLPLLAKLEEVLPQGTSGLIFQENGTYISEGRFIMKWSQYLKAAGIGELTPHQLRHAYATMLFEANVPAADAQELLGHAQYSTTMDIYTDIRAEHQKKVRKGLLNMDIQ